MYIQKIIEEPELEWDYYTEEYTIDANLIKIIKAPPMYADIDVGESEDEVEAGTTATKVIPVDIANDLDSIHISNDDCFGNSTNCYVDKKVKKERKKTRKTNNEICVSNNYRKKNEQVNHRNRKRVTRGARLQQIRTQRQNNDLKRKPTISIGQEKDKVAQFYLYKQYEEINEIVSDPSKPRIQHDDQ